MISPRRSPHAGRSVPLVIRRLSPFALRFIAACLATLLAQAAGTARLSGTLFTISSDSVVTVWPHARVTLTHRATGKAFSTVSGSVGEYSFSGFAPGEYQLAVSLAGFAPAIRDLRLDPGADLSLDIHLRPLGASERIEVNEPVSLIEPASTQAASPVLDAQTLKSIPILNDRFQDALPLLPGVLRGADDHLHIKGTRAAQSGARVNSTSVTDPVTGLSAISLPLEAVDFVRVLSNPFSPEYGRFAGAVVDLQTRGGTDAWRVHFTNFLPRARKRGANYIGIESFTPRFTVSGPLHKGKLYLLQALDYRFVRTRVPSLPELRNDTVLESFDSYSQLDWNINARHRLSASFVFYPQNLSFVGLNTFNPEAVTPNFRQRGFFAALSERAIFSSGGYLESSFSVKRFDAHTFAARQFPGGPLELSLHPLQNFGVWYSRQDRESYLYQFAQTLLLRPMQARGVHLFQLGYLFARATSHGAVSNLPVRIVRSDNTLSQRIDFTSPAALDASKNDFAFFLRDLWQVHPRFTVDLGFRVDHDSLSEDLFNFAPRFSIAFAPGRDNRSVFRFGAGRFYDKIPLNVSTFLSYPAQILTTFAADGVTLSAGPRIFTHRILRPGGALRIPYSIAWSFQFDREIRPGLLLRFGIEHRETRSDFVIEPFSSLAPALSELRLLSNGSQRYLEFQWTFRWSLLERTMLFFSFVRSRAEGDLNSFAAFFGNFPDPVVRPNQFDLLPEHAPNRFLCWGNIGLPWKLEFWPVLDVRDGFPFSAVDDDLNYVGRRNRAGAFPLYLSLDFQFFRPFRIPLFGRKWKTRVGLKFYNVTGHFNPRDVQRNVSLPSFGHFFNSVDRQRRGKFEIDF